MRIELTNRSDFVDSSGYTVRLIVLVDGAVVTSRRLPVPAIAPRATTKLSLALEKPALLPGEERVLRLVYELKRKTEWADAGHQVGFDEFVLGRGASPRRRRNGQPVAVARGGARIDVSAAGVTARFNATTGALTQLALDGRSLLARGPALSLWRAPTDNDGVRLHSRVGGVLPKWQQWNLAAPRSRVGRVVVPRTNDADSNSNER